MKVDEHDVDVFVLLERRPQGLVPREVVLARGLEGVLLEAFAVLAGEGEGGVVHLGDEGLGARHDGVVAVGG